MKTNQEYWAKRRAWEMYEYMESAEKEAEELAEVYVKAMQQVQDDAKRIFNKYQSRYGLSRKEAEKLLSKAKHPEDIREILRLLSADPKNEELIKELESQAYGNRIGHLNGIYNQVMMITQAIYAEERYRLHDLLSQLAEKAYYDTIFDIQQYSGYGFDFKTLSKKNIEEVLKQKWYGSNYSEKIWNNTEDLAKSVKKEIMLNLLTGRPLKKAADAIEKRFQTGYGNARRLARTESNYVCNQLHLKSYEASGIKKYIYVAILDLKTSEICQSLDKKVFLVSAAMPGLNYPPMHPWCRSTTIAYISAELLRKMKQSAIDPETGERILVPGDMTYQQWYDKYVKGKAVESIPKRRKNYSVDKEQHERYRSVLGDEIPEDIEGFQEMKYNNKELWNKLKHRYRVINSYESNSGSMDRNKIYELDEIAFNTKRNLFTGQAKRKGNIAIAEIDGNLKIASSQLDEMKEPAYQNFKGDKEQLVCAPENQKFKTLFLGNYDRRVDAEAKIFEYAAANIHDNKKHIINLLSEKTMCESCQGVMNQFKERYPNIEVNVVSNKAERNDSNGGNPWKYRR